MYCCITSTVSVNDTCGDLFKIKNRAKKVFFSVEKCNAVEENFQRFPSFG